MKYLLLSVAVIGAFFCIGVVFVSPPISTAPIYIKNPKELVSEMPQDSPLKKEVSNAVEIMNQRNADIESFLDENMSIVIQQDVAIRLQGSIAYEKDNRFRLIINRRFGAKEADIGSNDQVFWFWTRRHNPPNLFYADHKDVYKSKLKTPFHPLWMMESLGLKSIDLTDAKISEFEGNWKISQKRKSTLGHMVVKSTIIDPKRLVVLGHYVSTLSGQLIASTEVLEWNEDIPKTIIMRWHNENVSIKLKFNRPKINSKIPAKHWGLPNIKPKVNMAED